MDVIKQLRSGGPTVSVEQNKSIARRYLEDVWDRNDESLIDQLIASDYLVHDPGTPGRVGQPAGEKQVMAMYRGVFPDLHFVVEDVVGDGDQAVVRWRASGTHRGALMGIPPTGKRVEGTGMWIHRIAGGKVVEEWGQSDVLGLLQQLGAIPTEPTRLREPVGAAR
jgi:steroid delta-isomerase-like uncharacterized protein